MAVVKTIICSSGVTVHIHNDFYSEITEKEMGRRISEIKEFAKKIFLNAEVREINGGENLPKP
ncbi:MAG: hypothetical protein K2G04_07255 [Oscillospiraceae bacterium]|nr:hypothetical protein [Oscillospiraceae bacterium]